ncbi:hypothetical protein ZEAMMB73_Zm00001d008852, partial [Zea mays]
HERLRRSNAPTLERLQRHSNATSASAAPPNNSNATPALAAVELYCSQLRHPAPAALGTFDSGFCRTRSATSWTRTSTPTAGSPCRASTPCSSRRTTPRPRRPSTRTGSLLPSSPTRRRSSSGEVSTYLPSDLDLLLCVLRRPEQEVSHHRIVLFSIIAPKFTVRNI